MSGGAGYVLSKEAARRLVSGHINPSKCRPGDVGPEDVEMSRCLQRLGASFIDTRDKYGRYMLQIMNILRFTKVFKKPIFPYFGRRCAFPC